MVFLCVFCVLSQRKRFWVEDLLELLTSRKISNTKLEVVGTLARLFSTEMSYGKTDKTL